ncbi:MAG: hypothetical protein PWQ88_399 [Candidatus Methanomethylophilaceae archaeon]|nr:MAG: Radical SAM domain protein [Thermoplasmatales archaeon 49_6]MDI3482528.1 hypothetical protein [Candidatus Methanomethylophilaceae archaeon]
MAHSDIVFIHAPSVYDFRKKPMFYGPVSDVIPSSPVFEMYPIGFMTMSSHLERAGYRTRIVNLAVQMLADERFDVERRLRSLDADIFAIDLHWMPHAHGALEVAKLIKSIHPHAKIQLGGFTSTYFHEELMQRPEVDFVLRGDSTEPLQVEFMNAVTGGDDLSKVPNLCWKDKQGKVRTNPMNFVPDSLDYVEFDYGTMIKNSIRHLDIQGSLPWLGWDRTPLTSVFSVRGCSQDCAGCGGSAYAGRSFLCRQRPAFRSPEKLAEDIGRINEYLDSPIFVVGDLRQGGRDYCERFFSSIKDMDIDNHLILEIFYPAGRELYRMAEKALGEYSMQFSPESHERNVRRRINSSGDFDESAIISTTAKALDHGCQRFDMFFMIGLPYQTRESAIDTADFARSVWQSLNNDGRLFIYSAPFAPFVDPGSRGFEEPERYGYRFFARTLEEHRHLLDNPSWKNVLSYETQWMTRDMIAETTYDVALALNQVMLDVGKIDRREKEIRDQRTSTARSLLHEIDEILSIQDVEQREARLWDVRDAGMELMASTICDKRDLDWNANSIWYSSPRVIRGLLGSTLRSLRHLA